MEHFLLKYVGLWHIMEVGINVSIFGSDNMRKKQKILTKRKIITALFIISYLSSIKITMHFNDIKSIAKLLVNDVGLERVCYVIQILTGLCIIISAAIAVWQYYLSARCEINKQTMERVQKSIDLAEYYRINILPGYEKLNHIFKETKLIDVLKNIKKEDMKEFDEQELRKNLTEAQFEEIKKINMSEEFVNAIIKMDVVLDLQLGIENHVEVKYEEKAIKANRVAIKRKYNILLTEVLNKLEYFAMHFEHNTADESVVYQSLHQTYLSIVQMLYCDISRNNSTGHRKYYSNVIALYNRWYERDMKQGQTLIENDRKAVSKGTVIEKLD